MTMGITGIVSTTLALSARQVCESESVRLVHAAKHCRMKVLISFTIHKQSPRKLEAFESFIIILINVSITSGHGQRRSRTARAGPAPRYVMSSMTEKDEDSAVEDQRRREIRPIHDGANQERWGQRDGKNYE